MSRCKGIPEKETFAHFGHDGFLHKSQLRRLQAHTLPAGTEVTFDVDWKTKETASLQFEAPWIWNRGDSVSWWSFAADAFLRIRTSSIWDELEKFEEAARNRRSKWYIFRGFEICFLRFWSARNASKTKGVERTFFFFWRKLAIDGQKAATLVMWL